MPYAKAFHSAIDNISVLLCTGRLLELPVYGNGMSPIIYDGDCVVIRRYGKYKSGDIILTRSSEYRLYRLIIRGEQLYIQTGLFIKPFPITKNDILAKVIAIRHNAVLIFR